MYDLFLCKLRETFRCFIFIAIGKGIKIVNCMIYSYVNYVRHLYVLFLFSVVQLYLSSTFENTDARDITNSDFTHENVDKRRNW